MKFTKHQVTKIHTKVEENGDVNIQIEGPTYPKLFYKVGLENYRFLLGEFELDIDESKNYFETMSFIVEILEVEEENYEVITYTSETFKDNKDIEGRILLMENGDKPDYSMTGVEILVLANTLLRIVALAIQLEAEDD